MGIFDGEVGQHPNPELFKVNCIFYIYTNSFILTFTLHLHLYGF